MKGLVQEANLSALGLEEKFVSVASLLELIHEVSSVLKITVNSFSHALSQCNDDQKLVNKCVRTVFFRKENICGLKLEKTIWDHMGALSICSMYLISMYFP